MSCPEPDDLLAYVSGKAPEVEAHLGECAECRDTVLLLARTSLASPPEGTADVELALPARGTSVGRYLMLERIGQGGMGVVYTAYDPELDRKVALKLIRADRKQASVTHERLLREAQAMARLAHPNVVHVYDVGVWNEQVFVAMEWVEGGTLRQWLNAVKPHSTRDILKVFLDAGNGLAAAHAAGLVHRDFKPDNVLMGKNGRARVTDFGLARATGTGDSVDSGASPDTFLYRELTVSGVLIGTPAYMAPEQLRGERADARADVFSFCVALYEALYRKSPFSGSSRLERLAAIESERLPPPPAGSSRRLHRLISRGLKADSAARYSDLSELLAALERDAQPARPARIVAGMLSVVALGGALAFSAYRRGASCANGEERFHEVWDGPKKEALAQRFRATGLSFADTAWRSVADSLDGYRRDWQAMHLLACEATRRGEQSAELLDLRMQCLDDRLRGLDALTRLLGEADVKAVERAGVAASSLRPIAECADAQALREAVPPPRDPEARRRVAELSSAVAQAKSLGDLGKLKEAQAHIEPVVAAARKLNHPPLTGLALATAGWIQDQFVAFDKEHELYEAALPEIERARDDRLRFRVYELMARMLSAGKHRQADARVWAAMGDAVMTRLKPNHDERAFHACTLGVIDRDAQKIDDAVADFERCVELTRAAKSPLTYRALGSLCNVLGLKGDFARAIPICEQSLAVAEKQLGASHPDVSLALADLDTDLLQNAEFERALPILQRELALQEGFLEPDNLRIGPTLSNLGICLEWLGRYPEALVYHRRAIPVWEKGQGENRSFSDVVGEGNSLLAMGRAAEALPRYEQAIRMMKALKEDHDDQWAEGLFGLSRALWESGHERPRAKQLALQSLAELNRIQPLIPIDARLKSKVEAWLDGK